MPTSTYLSVLLLTLTNSVDGLAQPTCNAPPVDTVVKVALAHQGLNKARSWKTRLAWASLLPRLSTRVSRSLGHSEYWDLGHGRNDQDLNNYLALRWEFRATWDLSRMVFDSRELQISRRRSQLREERLRLVQRVIQLYYERCHLIAMHQKSADTLRRLAVVNALLDALTGGMPSHKGVNRR